MFFTKATIVCLVLVTIAKSSFDGVQAAPARSSPVEMALATSSQTSEAFLSEVARRLDQIYAQPERPRLHSSSVSRIILERLKKKIYRDQGNAKVAPEVSLSAPHSSPGSLSPENPI